MAPQFVEPKTLIDELLAQQKSLTAAARFAGIHEQNALPAQARYYRDLIPLNKPTPGQQYAFEVDLDKCSGCKACVTACHSLNGLDEDEVWRSVGVLHGAENSEAFQRTVTTACHHCVDPGCLNGCPVLAYEKDAVTGIVKHLDDQCIGCSYCVLKCPYDVPKYSEARGIVRKCDMCSSRLASGEAPACVQACPNEAIRITLVDRKEVSKSFTEATENKFLPDSPAPDYTRPTTQYRSAEPLPSNLRGADHAELLPAKAHPSLVFFLVLTQMSVGGFTLATLLGQLNRVTATISLAIGLLGLAISVSHLGKPLKAWRAFLGLRKSWLSREIIAFGLFAPLAILLTLSFWLPGPALLRLQQLMAVSVSLIGMSGVLCSVMVYHDTRRKFWRWPAATIKFAGTAVILGAALLLVTSGIHPAFVIIPAALKFLFELSYSASFWSAATWRRFPFSQSRELERTSALLTGPLRPLYILQLAALCVGGILLPTHAPLLSVALCLVAEVLERHLFFTAVSPDRMPGVAK